MQLVIVFILSTGFCSGSPWDVAVAVDDHVQFLEADGTVVASVSARVQRAYALGYNAMLRRLYFADISLNGTVFELTLPKVLGGEQDKVRSRTILNGQLHNVEGIAYDVMTDVLYWTTGVGRKIRWLRVSDANSAPQTGQDLTLLGGMEDQIPLALAINTCKRFLYWTSWSLKQPTIERAWLDGSHREQLVNARLMFPTAIAVDHTTDKIYWSNVRVGNGMSYDIESANVDGSNRRILHTGYARSPWRLQSLAVSSRHLFWTDSLDKDVRRIPLNNTYTSFPLRVMRYKRAPQLLVSSQPGDWDSDRCNPIIQPKTTIVASSRVTISTTKDYNSQGLG